MNSLLPSRWLALSPRARAGEFLGELADFLAGAATLEEAVRFACRRLAQFLEAETVVLFALDAADRRLDPVAASSPEWELMAPLGLEAVPDWQQAFDHAEPRWTERLPSVLLPGLDSPSLLTLPVIGLGRSYGCFVAAYDRAAGPPDTEDTRAGMAVARLFAPHLEAHLLRRQHQAGDRRRDTWRQLEEDLIQSDFPPAALQRLLSAVAADLRADAVGLFVRKADLWERVALTGAADTVPDSLPLQGARLDPPSPETAPGSPTIIPLGSRKNPLGLLFLTGRATESPGGNGAEWPRLALLAAMACAQQLSRRGQRSQADLFRALFETLPGSALLLDQHGRVLEANTALCDALGFPAAELRRRPLADFLLPVSGEALAAHLRAHPPHPFTLRAEWRAGARAAPVYELQLQPLSPSSADNVLWLAWLRDTELEPRAEARARSAEACLDGVVDAVQDGVWLLDAHGTVLRANQRLAQLFGVSPQDFGPGLPQAEILQALKLNFTDPEEACAGWRRLHDQPDQVAWDEVELLRPHRILERFARPLRDSRQRLVGRLEVYRDLADRRLPEDKLVHRERLATLGHLLSGIAHELNNPLTAVTGYAELLRGSRLPARLKEKVNRMADEAERAGRILRSILLFARADHQARQAVDVVELLERTLALRAYELKVANIQVVRDFEADLPPLAANPTHLQQVFLNVLLNAEQAIRSQRRHGRITLRARHRSEEESLLVEVADDGPGVSPAVLPHIFEPFFTIKPPTLSTGLGLSISQAIIRQHGGEITVESQSGQGAVFRILLPAGSVAALRPAPSPSERTQLPPRPGRRVLVVDDEPVVAHLIADTLRQQRFVVRVHTDSRRALSEASEKDFDLVICDLRMPELDGPTFYRLLQERKPSLSRRLLFTTGDTLARDTARFLEQVDLPNLAKPFHVDELRAAVTNAISDLEKSTPDPGTSPPQERRTGR